MSSQLSIENGLRGQDRVLATCEVLGATQYVNPIGGLDLYSEKVFRERGIELTFLRSAFPPYPQFDLPFVGMLSIVDVLMFADPQTIYGDLATRFENVVR